MCGKDMSGRMMWKKILVVSFSFFILFSLVWTSGFLFESLSSARSNALRSYDSGSVRRDIEDLRVSFENVDSGAKFPEFGKTMQLMAASQTMQGLLSLYFAGENSHALKELGRVLVEHVQIPALKFEGQLNHEEQDGFGVYKGHQLLVLCGNRILSQDQSYDDQIQTLTVDLRNQSLRKEFHGIVPPYNSLGFRSPVFPADQSAVLLGLWICDQSFRSQASVEPILFFFQEQESSEVFREKGLHPSGWNYAHQNRARGVGMAYEISNLVYFAPDKATELYESFRRHHFVKTAGFGGFREWPCGESHEADVDSGPVIFGVGSAATALVLSAVRVLGDEEVWNSVHASGSMVGGVYSWKKAKRYFLLDVIDFSASFIFDPATTHANFIQSFLLFSRASLFASRVAGPWFLRTRPHIKEKTERLECPIPSD